MFPTRCKPLVLFESAFKCLLPYVASSNILVVNTFKSPLAGFYDQILYIVIAELNPAGLMHGPYLILVTLGSLTRQLTRDNFIMRLMLISNDAR